MEFKFDISLTDMFDDYYDETDFKHTLRDAVIDTLAEKYFCNDFLKYNSEHEVESLRYAVECKIDKVIKDNQNKIIELVSDKVANSIIKKKKIIEMTPKVRELAKIDKDNENYFTELIDKAIAKRFKG